MEVARGVGDEGILGIVDKQLEVKNQVRGSWIQQRKERA